QRAARDIRGSINKAENHLRTTSSLFKQTEPLHYSNFRFRRHAASGSGLSLSPLFMIRCFLNQDKNTHVFLLQ
ncbi:hypothetical protein, partial [Martelella mediterranea]|uniref:hypothetical protein n=1 Tax=Martelella mediterranea TaxID=293089 RepID=UPI001A9CC041